MGAIVFRAGYRREGFPELMGWGELVAQSGRSSPTVSEMRDELLDFPRPVTVLMSTPVYLADEVRQFFTDHPRRHTRITRDIHRRIQEMRRSGLSCEQVAEELGIGSTTVSKYTDRPLK